MDTLSSCLLRLEEDVPQHGPWSHDVCGTLPPPILSGDEVCRAAGHLHPDFDKVAALRDTPKTCLVVGSKRIPAGFGERLQRAHEEVFDRPDQVTLTHDRDSVERVEEVDSGARLAKDKLTVVVPPHNFEGRVQHTWSDEVAG